MTITGVTCHESMITSGPHGRFHVSSPGRVAAMTHILQLSKLKRRVTVNQEMSFLSAMVCQMLWVIVLVRAGGHNKIPRQRG